MLLPLACGIVISVITFLLQNSKNLRNKPINHCARAFPYLARAVSNFELNY